LRLSVFLFIAITRRRTAIARTGACVLASAWRVGPRHLQTGRGRNGPCTLRFRWPAAYGAVYPEIAARGRISPKRGCAGARRSRLPPTGQTSMPRQNR